MLCRPEGTEKITLWDEHETEVVFRKKEDDNVESEFKIAETHYFEVNLARGKEMWIKLKSEKSEIIYHNPSATLFNVVIEYKKFNVNESHVQEVKQMEQGDVMGLVCSFINGEDGTGYSLCQFLINGESIGRAMRMTGKMVAPMICINPTTTTVHSSLAFGKSKIEEGNISIN